MSKRPYAELSLRGGHDVQFAIIQVSGLAAGTITSHPPYWHDGSLKEGALWVRSLTRSIRNPSPMGEISSAVGESPSSLGQSILSLLHAASDRLESETQQSVGAAHNLSQELRVAKDRIEKLEAEVQLYRETAQRAQAWLGKMASEVEDRLLKQPEETERLQ
jgi:hypothetical protein